MTSTKPVTLVTGASSGIGNVTAETLLQAGYTAYGTRSRNCARIPDNAGAGRRQ